MRAHVLRASWTPVLALTLATSLVVWIPLFTGNGLAARPADALVLFFELALFHATLFAAVGATTCAVLAARRHERRTRRSVRGWIFGAGLGTLVALNAVLSFPVVYGPFNTRDQPFVTPLGLWSFAVFLTAPFVLGAAMAGLFSRRRRRLMVAAGWAVAFAVTVVVHLATQRPAAVDLSTLSLPSTPDEPGEAGKRRVVLLGFDGLEWNVLVPLIERGELPNFARLAGRGARGALATDLPTLSPAIWTTIATGRRPRDHGVYAFSKFLLPGMATPLAYGPYLSTPNWWNGLNRFLLQARFRGWIGHRPVFSTDRRVPAIWDVADRHGLAAGMVGWYAGWPVATPLSGGFRVSDFGPRAGSLAPADELRALVAESRPVEDVLRPPGSDPFIAFTWQESWDAANRASALLARYAPRVAAVYVRFPDPVEHHAWRGERFWLRGGMPDLDRLPVELVDSYRLFDRLLGVLLEAAGRDAVIFLVSDHGFCFDGRQHHHAPPGVLVAAGPGVRRGAVVEGASIYDLFPTVLTLLELPVTAEAPGRVLAEVFAPGSLPPRRTVASYGWYDPRAGRRGERSRAVEEEELRRLRALGYVN